MMAHHPQVLGMQIDPQEDAFIPRICPLRRGQSCGVVNLVLVMSVGLHINPVVDGLVGQRIPLRPHFKLPPLAALANTHAILGR